MIVHDISPLISEALAVYPNDKPFSRNVSKAYKQGDEYALSSISSTLHIGAHTDAHYHYNAQGATVESMPLSAYVGHCQVIDVSQAAVQQGRIHPEHFADITIQAPRILFKTGSYPEPNQWCDDFWAVAPETVALLASHQVQLIGIDTPSFDLASDEVLHTHQMLFKHQIANLEGLVLSAVPAGCYTLIALPLKIQGAEASPVRAVLIEGALST